MHYPPLATDGRPGAAREERPALFVAGDDADAKQLVAGLIDQLGFVAVDTGSPRGRWSQERPGGAL